MNIWMTLERACYLTPEKIGVVDGDRRFTYLQVKERVECLANYFKSCGIARGDRISILEVNSHSFLEAYYAAAAIGAVLNPLNYRLSAKETVFILNNCDARCLIANVKFGKLVEGVLKEKTSLARVLWIGGQSIPTRSIPSEEYEAVIDTHRGDFQPELVSGDDIAHLYYTSGTTGRPKGVMLTHNNVCLHALGTIAELHLTDADIWGHIATMFHLADAWATFAITWVGARHVMVPEFNEELVFRVIQDERITLSNLIPTMLNLMIKHPKVSTYDYSSLRVILSGGSPIAPEVVRSILKVFGCDYIQTYGMTETSPYLTLSILKHHLKNLADEAQLNFKAKTGRPLINVNLKVVDEQGQPVAADGQQVGEIRVKGETITPGYWNLPEETEKAFDNGWLKTGDLAVVDEEGYVNIVDRIKDMILSGGENIYSTEIENVLYQHPKILEAAAFGIPDEKWGEAVKAAVVLRSGEHASEGDIIDFCKEHLASYKAPKSIDFIQELPKTGSGKIYKKGLKDPYWQSKSNKI